MQPKTFQVMHLGMISCFTVRKKIPWVWGDNSAVKINTIHLCLHFSFRSLPKWNRAQEGEVFLISTNIPGLESTSFPLWPTRLSCWCPTFSCNSPQNAGVSCSCILCCYDPNHPCLTSTCDTNHSLTAALQCLWLPRGLQATAESQCLWPGEQQLLTVRAFPII